MCTRCNPSVVGLELHADPVVKYPQVTVRPAYDCLRHDSLHFLRNHPDIGRVAAVVRKAVEADAVFEITEQDNIVLEHNVGSPAAATSTTAVAASATTVTAAVRMHGAAAAAAARVCTVCAPASGASGSMLSSSATMMCSVCTA